MTKFSFTPPTPEAAFLLTCARVRLQDVDAHQLLDLLARPPAWDRLVALAARHSLLLLLGRHLQALPAAAIPAAVLARLKAHQQAVMLRNLGFTGELVRVLRLFEQHQLPALPFKGPTLAQAAYGNPALREYGDLDLLLCPTDVPRARSLLADHGYRPQYELTPAQEAAYFAYQGQIPLEKPDRAIVELHASLSPRMFPFDLSLARLWPRRCVVTLAGQAVVAPSPEDLLLILCMHGAKHLWKNLGWICDVAELLRVQPSLDWGHVCREARHLRSERMLCLGLQLAEGLLQAPLPREIARTARRDQTARALSVQTVRHLFDDEEWIHSGLESAAFHLRLREHWRDGLRFSASLFLTPTLADWQALSIPPPLAILYYGVRPLRLVAKYLPFGKSPVQKEARDQSR